MQRPLAVLFAILTCVAVTAGQSNVDKLVEELEFLSNGSLNNWKYSTDFKSDPTRWGFDDSAWDTLKLHQAIYPDSCWLRKEIVLPARYLGQPIHGTVRFLVSVDDYGYLWVNGEARGRFPWDGEFVLTNEGRAGQRFLIAMKAINTGGPLRLLRAQIAPEDSSALKQTLLDLSLSLSVGQKLLGFDTYQTNSRVKVDPGIDKSAMDRSEKRRLNELLQSLAPKLDIGALNAGDLGRFRTSLTAVRQQLKPIDEYAKRFTLYFDANAHIDAAWLWRSKETIEVCKNTFSSVINMMNARPDFTYAQSAAAYYAWMEESYPDLFRKMQDRVKTGRWEIVGGMWVEPDCNLPGGPSWARHLLYAKRYFREKFGVDVKVGWNPDSFGYNWNMPQFYRNAGIDGFITQKIGWNETNVFPYRLFWWQSPDGSRILSYFPFDYVSTVDDPFRLVDWLRQFEANTGFTKMMVLFGVGDHGGGPSLAMLQRIDRLKSLDVFPAIEHGTTKAYLNWLKDQGLDAIPVWNDELYLEYHQGTFTTQAKMKEFNRTSEVLLTNGEKFAAIDALYGGRNYRGDHQEAWKRFLFNQFHDILPGSSIREVYIDASEDHKAVQEIGNYTLQGSLRHLAREINTAKIARGMPVVVFNALGWERDDIVRLALPAGEGDEYSVFDGDGREVLSQTVKSGRYNREIMFRATRVPPLGYKLFELRKGLAQSTNPSLLLNKNTLENQFFRVTVDSDSGSVKSVVDKRSGRELLAGFGNRLRLLEDKPSAWDAWNIGLTGLEYPSQYRKIEVVESGPVRIVLRVHRDYLKPGVVKDFPTEDYPSSFFTQDIMLCDSVDRIDFRTTVDWWEDKTMLKVSFPLSFTDTVATYEIPYGTIQRSTQLRTSWEQAKVEVPAQHWADVTSHDYGVSLLNAAKYGYDIKGNEMRLSLLRSPKWPDQTADRGKHTMDYALYPHQGNWRTANTVRKGYEYNNPLLAIITDAHTAPLLPPGSFIRINPANAVLASVKMAEDADAWVIQWFESAGEDCMTELVLPQSPKRIVRSNFLEEDGEPITFTKRTVRLPLTRNSIQTVKVYF